MPGSAGSLQQHAIRIGDQALAAQPAALRDLPGGLGDGFRDDDR